MMLAVGVLVVLYGVGFPWAVVTRRKKFEEALGEDRTLPGSCLEGLVILAGLFFLWPVIVFRPPKRPTH